MIIDNIEMLDIDEGERKERVAGLNPHLVDFVRRYDLVLDIATSDVSFYIRDHNGNEISIA